jgi:hypothetical protein
MQYKGTRKSVRAIGKELNVDAVIEGSVLRSGDKIRITVQLIRADTGEHLWSGTYDRELQDVLALQSDVTYGIARHIEVAVSGAPRGSPVAPRTVAPGVYEAYLKGRLRCIRAAGPGSRRPFGTSKLRFDADGTSSSLRGLGVYLRSSVAGFLRRASWRQKGYVPAAAFLNAYLGLGDKEEAFAWLERAAEERSNITQFLEVHPFFDPLRGDPRFAVFLRRANLQ